MTDVGNLLSSIGSRPLSLKICLLISAGGFILLGAACSPHAPIETFDQPTETWALAPSEPAIDWVRYHDAGRGFSFEYPAAYESSLQQGDCSLSRVTTPDGTALTWGARSSLTIFQASSPPERFLRERLQGRVEDLQFAASSVADGPAVHATYRFGGTARYGEAYAFEHHGELYVAELTAGVFCEIPGSSMLEPAVLERVIASFQFDS